MRTLLSTATPIWLLLPTMIAGTAIKQPVLHPEPPCEATSNVEYIHAMEELASASFDGNQTVQRPVSWKRLAGIEYAAGFASAWEWLETLPTSTLLSTDLIQTVHSKVMVKHVLANAPAEAFQPQPSSYRQGPAWVMETTFAEASLIQSLMDNLIQSVEFDTVGSIFAKAATVMAGLLHIHPFEDGNGRTAVL